jgi:hypothetical protein
LKALALDKLGVFMTAAGLTLTFALLSDEAFAPAKCVENPERTI